MSETYAVGRGRPPRHTQFRKGRSGNPGGKARPAGTLKGRLRQALEDALARGIEKVETMPAPTTLESAVREMVLSAASGETSALRLMLSLIDRIEPAVRAKPEAEPNAAETAPLSLLQGKKQGRAENPSAACEKRQANQQLPESGAVAAGKNGAEAAKTEVGTRAFSEQFLNTLNGTQRRALDDLVRRHIPGRDGRPRLSQEASDTALGQFLRMLRPNQANIFASTNGAAVLRAKAPGASP